MYVVLRINLVQTTRFLIIDAKIVFFAGHESGGTLFGIALSIR